VSILKDYSVTARCCALDKAVWSAYENIKDFNNELIDWAESDGYDELTRKVEGIKVEADLLLSRVQALMGER